MSRYARLAAIVLVLGALLAVVGRMTRHHAAPAAGAPVARAEVTLDLRIDSGGLTPRRAAVPSGARVAVGITNDRPRAVTVVLAGYEDRLLIGSLPAGGHWAGTFIADRPGDDFAWTVSGEPAGVLSVAGSHLVEGHR